MLILGGYFAFGGYTQCLHTGLNTLNFDPELPKISIEQYQPIVTVLSVRTLHVTFQESNKTSLLKRLFPQADFHIHFFIAINLFPAFH